MSARILVVEDEEALTTLLHYNLDAEGYEVETVARGDEAETSLKERLPDLIVLDWMLPGLSGIELCRRLRARAETRSLPIIMLTARGEESERVRGLATEYRLLEFFLEHPGRVFSREQLLDRVWGRDIYIDERTVDVHIGRLRKLLNPGGEQDPIRTVRGAGYALDDRFAKVEP
ncbi:MAG: winged helix-turn-helix domain-containing protein [Bradyrhizobium sp.]|nr:winged helix-turn-helix domain-containing protein [Bradyrhizobium sp.]